MKDNLNSKEGQEYMKKLREMEDECWVKLTDLDISQTVRLLAWTEKLRDALRTKCMSFEPFVCDVSEPKPFELDNLYEDELGIAVHKAKISNDMGDVFRLLNRNVG